MSTDHIKQTEADIKNLESKINETKKKVKDQEKVHKEAVSKIQSLGKIKSFKPPVNLFESTHMDGIEVFQVEEEEENISELEEEADEI